MKLVMLKNRTEFETANILCDSIIKNFDPYSNIGQWLFDYASLYGLINIQPKGLPAISNSNHEGTKYEHIYFFHKMYTKIKYEHNILDVMNEIEAVIYFIEKMDSMGISRFLDNEVIMQKDAPDFWYLLATAFARLQEFGNTKLKCIKSYCKSCNKEKYLFVGNKEGSYINLDLKIENGKVLDINECDILKCYVPIEIDTEKQIFLDTEYPPF